MSNMSPCLEVITPLTLAHALELAARKATHDAFQFQCQQHRRCGIRRQAAALTQGVEIEGIETQRSKQRIVRRDFIIRIRCSYRAPVINRGAKLFENVPAAGARAWKSAMSWLSIAIDHW